MAVLLGLHGSAEGAGSSHRALPFSTRWIVFETRIMDREPPQHGGSGAPPGSNRRFSPMPEPPCARMMDMPGSLAPHRGGHERRHQRWKGCSSTSGLSSSRQRRIDGACCEEWESSSRASGRRWGGNRPPPNGARGETSAHGWNVHAVGQHRVTVAMSANPASSTSSAARPSASSASMTVAARSASAGVPRRPAPTTLRNAATPTMSSATAAAAG